MSIFNTRKTSYILESLILPIAHNASTCTGIIIPPPPTHSPHTHTPRTYTYCQYLLSYLLEAIEDWYTGDTVYLTERVQTD